MVKPFPSWENRRRKRPPPLVVPTTHERSTRTKYYCGQTVSVPRLGDVLITEEHIVQAQLDAHFGPKPAPPPKEKVPQKMIDHFIRMARAPAPKPVDSDYERQIRKLHRARL